MVDDCRGSHPGFAKQILGDCPYTGKGHDCRREFRYLRNLYDGGILDNIHLAEHDLITYVFYKYHYLTHKYLDCIELGIIPLYCMSSIN